MFKIGVRVVNEYYCLVYVSPLLTKVMKMSRKDGTTFYFQLTIVVVAEMKTLKTASKLKSVTTIVETKDRQNQSNRSKDKSF